MAELQPPIALQNVATLNADDFRQLVQALVPTEGVAGTGDLTVTANGTPNMSVNVAAGRAFILGDNSTTTQGMYTVANDATVNKVIAASDPTNPRWDIVVAEVRDAFYSGSSNDWQIRVVTGTPAASPAEPSLPLNAIKLARVVVGAAVTSITSANITDTRTRAAFGAAPGGTLGHAQVTAVQGPITAEVDLTGLTVTVNLPASRRIKITGMALFNSTVAGDEVRLLIKEGTTTLQTAIHALSTASAFESLHGSVVLTPSAGSHTYKLSGVRNSGTGTVNMTAAATIPAFILVEDIGAV